MSVGNNLQEMENVVTKGAAPAEPMQAAGVPVEDLGGPTPENSRPDDGSNALKTPGATLKQVRDVVNAKAVKAEEVETEEETISEEELETAEETVAESEETTAEVTEESEEDGEVVAEEEDVIEYDMEEDVQALLQGEELSEEFQEKARTIFETAINAKAAEIQEVNSS